MNYYKNALQVLEMKINSPKPISHVGLTLRESRIRQHQTLEFVSDKICTPATLSKIELGMIHPSPKILQNLLKRLTLDSIPDIKKSPHHDWLSSFRLVLDQGNLHYLESIYQISSEPYPYQTVLKQFVINLTLSHLNQIHLTYEYLLNFQPYMSLEECLLFYHFVGVYHLKLENPILTIKYYRLAFKLSQHLKLENSLLSLHLAQYYFNFNHSIQAIHHLNDALQGFSSRYLMKYTLECELLLCEDYIKNHVYTKVPPLMFKLYHQLKLDDPFHYLNRLLNLMGDYYFKIKEYNQAERYYKKALFSESTAPSSLMKLLHLYYQSAQSTKQVSLIQKVKLNKDLPQEIIYLIKYYEFLTHDPYGDLFRIFLLKEAIPVAIQSADFHQYERYATALINLYLEKGKYKMAFQTQDKLSKYHESLLLS